MALSNAQVDRLGTRLKQGIPTESDLRELDEYSLRAGGPAYSIVRKPSSLTGEGAPSEAPVSLFLIEMQALFCYYFHAGPHRGPSGRPMAYCDP